MPFGVVSRVRLGRGVLDFGGDRRHFATGQRTSHTDAYADTPSRAESHSASLVLNGDNMLGLCDPSNLLLVFIRRGATHSSQVTLSGTCSTQHSVS